MLAARLCFAWGIPDVYGWLNSQPKEVIDFWEAFDSIEPIGEAWMQSARIGMQVSMGQALEPRPTMDDFLPPRFHKDTRRGNDSIEIARKQLGG